MPYGPILPFMPSSRRSAHPRQQPIAQPQQIDNGAPDAVQLTPSPIADNGLWGSIGRAFGAAKMNGGYGADGSYVPETPAHPILDSLFNRSQAANAAHIDLQQRALQAYQKQQSDERAKLGQRLGIATGEGVAAYDENGQPTTAMRQVEGPLGEQQIGVTSADLTNASKDAAMLGRFQDSDDAQISFNQGANAAHRLPVAQYMHDTQIVAPSPGSVGVEIGPDGQPITVSGGQQNSTTRSQTIGMHLDKAGNIVPATTTGESQAGVGQGNFSIPLPEHLQGNDSIQDVPAAPTVQSEDQTGIYPTPEYDLSGSNAMGTVPVTPAGQSKPLSPWLRSLMLNGQNKTISPALQQFLNSITAGK